MGAGVMSNKRIGATAASVLAVVAFWLPGPAWAGNEKIMIGWSAIAGSQAPFWITKEAGLFEKNGLDSTMIYIDGGSRATQALMSGDVPIVRWAVMHRWWRGCVART